MENFEAARQGPKGELKGKFKCLWTQDGALPHTSKKSQSCLSKFLTKKRFMTKEQWPPASPDAHP